MKLTKSSGFTLIEILVVVVIVSILTVMGVQMISSGSVERNLQQHGNILKSTLEYSCDQATLQNIPYGVSFSVTGYSFFQFINQQWIAINVSDIEFTRFLTDGSLFSLEIDSQSIVLDEEFSEIPQIMCDSTGQLTAFNLVISDTTEKHRYQLRTPNFWQVQGQWLDEK